MDKSNYKILKRKFPRGCQEAEAYCIMAHRIESIIKQEKKNGTNICELLKGLLCVFEAKKEKSIFYSIYSIVCSFLICCLTFLIDALCDVTQTIELTVLQDNILGYVTNNGISAFSLWCAFILGGATIFFLILAKKRDKENEHIIFCLGVLKDKYDEYANEQIVMEALTRCYSKLGDDDFELKRLYNGEWLLLDYTGDKGEIYRFNTICEMELFIDERFSLKMFRHWA